MEEELYPKSFNHWRKLLEETGLHCNALLHNDGDEVHSSICSISCCLYVAICRRAKLYSFVVGGNNVHCHDLWGRL